MSAIPTQTVAGGATSAAKPRGRFVRSLGAVLMLAAGGLGVLAATGRLPHAGHEAAATPPADAKPAERAPQSVVVTVAAVTPRAVQRRVQVVGTFFGHDEISLAPEVGGRIVRIAHDVGDVVRPGEVLLEIDPTDSRLAITEAARAVELELAKLGLSEPPGPQFDIRTVPSVQKADLLERDARTALERVERLAQRKAATQEQWDQAQTDHRVAQTNARQALLDAGQTLAAVRHKQAILATMQQQLADTRLLVPQPSAEPTAPRGLALVSASSPNESAPPPVEYVVAERMVSEGEMIQTMPPTVAFRLVMDQPLKFKATVPERYVGEVRVGQRVELSVEAYPGEMFAGTVARINPTVDRLNRTFQIEVHVPNPSRRLRAGSFAKASVLTREDAGVPTVPEQSLVKFAGVTKVFLIEEGRSRAIPVQPGVRLELRNGEHRENWIEVRGAIPPGAAVVTTGHSQLADGTPIRIRETPRSRRGTP